MPRTNPRFHRPEGYCKHGVYVGGCGIDWVCGRCEPIEPEPHWRDEYRYQSPCYTFQVGEGTIHSAHGRNGIELVQLCRFIERTGSHAARPIHVTKVADTPNGLVTMYARTFNPKESNNAS